MRLIQATYPGSCAEAVRTAIEAAKPDHYRIADIEGGDYCVASIFFSVNEAQALVDSLQEICEAEDNWRIVVLPVEATAPTPAADNDRKEEREARRDKALREEVYTDMVEGAELNARFFVLVFASALVAAVGLNSDNVAAVIGGMVIAPLLGPILAVTFGVTMGDIGLIARSGRAALLGLLAGIAGAAAVGLFMEINYDSGELMRRTVVGVDSIALALAAGAAAALAVVSGQSTALVGVMVAVALLPPAAAVGLFAGAEQWVFAGRALALTAVNIVCIMLASQAVYWWKGVRPRKWREAEVAKRGLVVSLAVLGVLVAAATALVLTTPIDTMPEDPSKQGRASEEADKANREAPSDRSGIGGAN